MISRTCYGCGVKVDRSRAKEVTVTWHILPPERVHYCSRCAPPYDVSSPEGYYATLLVYSDGTPVGYEKIKVKAKP
jgi:hypothetical protein